MKPSLVRTLQILFRRRWIIVNFWIVTVAVVTTASYLVAPLYVASAKFLVIPGNEQLPIFTLSSTVADRVVATAPQTGDILSELELLQSRPVLDRVIDQLGLDRHNDGDTPQPTAMQRINGAVNDFLIQLGLTTAVNQHEATLAALGAGLKVQPVRLSNVFTVDFTGPNPANAAKIVNTLAEEYLAARRDVYKPVGIVEHFRDKLDQQKEELKAAQERLRAYQDKYDIANLEIETEDTLRLLDEAKKNGAFNRQVDQYTSRLATLRAAAPAIRDLRFDVANSQTLYQHYLEKYDEVSSNAELSDAKFANVRLIEGASANSPPIFPHRFTNLLLSIIAGGLGGIGLVLAMNYFSNKLNTIEDVEVTGVQALGSVPRFKRRSGFASERSDGVFSLIAEQVLGTCASGFVLSGIGTQVGCTTVSAGLALAMSKGGERRLLIVEADGSQQRLRQLLPTTDAPVEEARAENGRSLTTIIRPTRYTNVDVLMPATNAARDIDAADMRALLGVAMASYDLVVIDAPPLFASPMAFALAKGMKGWGVILVLEAGRTSSQLVRRATELVERQGIALFGAILNKREDSLPNFIYRRL